MTDIPKDVADELEATISMIRACPHLAYSVVSTDQANFEKNQTDYRAKCLVCGLRWYASRPKAFTLIELLLVVAVIAVLIGILVPAMASARESARNAKCLANLHTIGQAFADYRGNHRGDAPLPGDLDLDAPAWVCPCFAARNRDSTQPHFTQWSFTNPRVYGAILDTRPAATWPITGDMTVVNHGGKAVAVGTPPVMQYVLRGGFTNSVYLDGHAGRK